MCHKRLQDYCYQRVKSSCVSTIWVLGILHLFSNYCFSFSRIPKGDIGLLWVKAIQKFQPNFVPNPRTVICSSHFLNTDYTYSVVGGKLMLKKSSIPSIFNVNNVKLAQCEDLVEDNEVTLNELPTSE